MNTLEKTVLTEMDCRKNEISLEMYDKSYESLEIAERQMVDDYIHDLDYPVWKHISHRGMTTVYDISNLGDVRNRITGLTLKQKVNKDGYMMFNLCPGDGSKVTVTIHKLVATAFIPNPENKPVVNHKNGKKDFNWYKNLEWATYQENTQHAMKTGLAPKDGVDNPNNKYDEDIIHTVCKLLEDGHTPTKISRMIDVSVTLPENIKRGKLWKEIASQYNIPEPVSVKRSDELKAYMEELIYAGYTNREIVQASGLPDTEHEREYVGLFRRRLFKKTI